MMKMLQFQYLNLLITSTVFHPCLNFPSSISMDSRNLWFLDELHARAYFQYIYKMTVSSHRSILISVLKRISWELFRPNASTVEISMFFFLDDSGSLSSKSCFYLGLTVFIIKVHEQWYLYLLNMDRMLKSPAGKTTGKGKNHCGVFVAPTAVCLREMSLMRDAN